MCMRNCEKGMYCNISSKYNTWKKNNNLKTRQINSSKYDTNLWVF